MSHVDNLVEIIPCKTANEFIATLRITNDLWLPPKSREAPWLFRGQGNANDTLIPSVWRSTPPGEENTLAQKLEYTFLRELKEPIKQSIIKGRKNNPYDDIDADEFEEAARQNPNLENVLLKSIFEIQAVRHFAEVVDRLGFPIPRSGVARMDTDSMLDWEAVIYWAIKILKGTNWKGRPEFAIWSAKDQAVVALARHHGVPSSLLDWTRKPLIAAFFAADDNVDVNKFQYPELLAVWAIHTSVIGGLGQRLQRPLLSRSELGYLHAQDGVLTFDVGADWFFINNGQWPSLLQTVAVTKHELDHTPIRKITLPTSEAREVLRLLWAEEISRPHLMPSFDNIVITLKQHWPEF